MPQIKFHAVGPHEGKTITLDRFEFVDGVYTFNGGDQDIAAIGRVMREQYQAFPSYEFEAAKKAFEEAQAEAALAEPETSPAIVEMTIKQRVTARRFIDEKLDPATVYGPGVAADQLNAMIAVLRAEDDEGNDVLNADELAQLRASNDEADRLKREAEEKEVADKKAEDERLEKEAADKVEADRLAKEAADKAEQDRLDKEAADKLEADAAAEADRVAKEAADKAEADRIAAEALLQQQNGGQQQAPVDPEKPEGEPEQQDNGGGEQQPEGAKIETVADALQALDPKVDEHWTARGVPSIEAMTKLLGRSVSRAEIEEQAPDYTRSVAKAAKAAS